MPKFSGSFTGRANWQTTIPQRDVAGHDISLVEINGVQKSTDAGWNNAKVTYWGLGDTISGNGTQRGSYVNEHSDGTYDRGTFEAKVTIQGSQMTMEGTFTFTGGTGKYNGATGGGSFRSRSTSPTQLECTWEGAYQLVEAKAGRG